MDFTIKLDLSQINLVMRALGRQPYDDVAALIANIAAQANSQSVAGQRPVGQAEPEGPGLND